ncbi:MULTISPECIES: SAM-dependent methyltransferase [Streptomyces]|uniref:Methyltransferase type 11 n=2 Tax=Streptomyces TaxID=1883 RepID=A0A380PC29_STRGR|nr:MULTISPECIES: class I SAM-dependent methyltransferase [Streptomyces]NEE41199.1 class I SAM-dependent methyltransferase [Streptomyces sp. SID7982]PJM84856.1 SAM-dependent methyltransferase [Streptomyces sp. TSRI0384-2]QNE81290.1 methyltransferase domain-containing protein [Streptomyces rutgersensis]RPK91635.1 Demethylrebeccamycin-D-glucose O-methyltransferase [Streptomyces sp. ADI98-12]SUP62404.1 Methyltransferase type 11 [Streptomyces griseus]
MERSGAQGREVRSVEDVLLLLDGLFTADADRWTAGAASFWDGFYADRERPVPFFVAAPDANLARHLGRGLVRPGGRVLDLGCGPGRNALLLAAEGYRVDAVDLSPAAVDWARDRAREAGAEIRFHLGDAFAPDAAGLDGPYDLIHDSGCFHQLPPHRRVSYLALLDRLLAPGGHLVLNCFVAGAEGSGTCASDAELYRRPGLLRGGLGYTADALRRVFAGLEEIELRRMDEEPVDSPHFGVPFLWNALFRRPGG